MNYSFTLLQCFTFDFLLIMLLYYFILSVFNKDIIKSLNSFFSNYQII